MVERDWKEEKGQQGENGAEEDGFEQEGGKDLEKSWGTVEGHNCLKGLTSHMLSWKERLSFSSSSAISPPLTSVLTIPY